MLAGIAPRFPRWKFVATSFSDVASEDQETVAADSDGSISVLLSDSKKYQLLNNLQDASIVSSWLDDVKASKAKRFFKSATPPAEPVDADGVLTLTGRTFNEHVMDPKKDVFVEFYAPWCGHCKKLEPIWSEMARTIKKAGFDKKGVVIAKMDATENQCEEEVTGFPKLVFYPAVASKKKFKARSDYGGKRELEDMMDFVMETAVNLEGVESWTTTPTTKKKGKKNGWKTEL
jgi:protein disulfide-isomerase-like protein